MIRSVLFLETMIDWWFSKKQDISADKSARFFFLNFFFQNYSITSNWLDCNKYQDSIWLIYSKKGNDLFLSK